MKHVDKSWGWEKWFANTDDYCGKELFVKRGRWSSKGRYHYHKIKDETFYIIKGTLKLKVFLEGNDFPTTFVLNKGDSYRVKPGIRHKFTAMPFMGCYFIEASTTHRDDDSYRCSWDETRKEWIEVL